MILPASKTNIQIQNKNHLTSVQTKYNLWIVVFLEKKKKKENKILQHASKGYTKVVLSYYW